MPRRLRFSDDALADLAAARGWLTQPGAGPAARKHLAAILANLRQLRQQPCLHPVGVHRGVREMPCPGGYRALYEVVPDTGDNARSGDVTVLRIYGPGQDRTEFRRS